MDPQLNQPINVTDLIKEAIAIDQTDDQARSVIESIVLKHKGIHQFVECIFSQAEHLKEPDLKEYPFSKEQQAILSQWAPNNTLEAQNLRQIAIKEVLGLIAVVKHTYLRCDDPLSAKEQLEASLTSIQPCVINKLTYPKATWFIHAAQEACHPRFSQDVRSEAFMQTIKKISFIASCAEALIQDTILLNQLECYIKETELFIQKAMTRLSNLIAQQVEKEIAVNHNRIPQSISHVVSELKTAICGEFINPVMSDASFWARSNTGNIPPQSTDRSNTPPKQCI